jgi:O-antigen ligase
VDSPLIQPQWGALTGRQVADGLSFFLSIAVWLCPFWLGPTPAVWPLLWGGSCLGLWLLLTPRVNLNALDRWLVGLLGSLAVMVAWRSQFGPHALAAALCLLAIGLATCLSQALTTQGKAHWMAWAWLIAGLVNSVMALTQYTGVTLEAAGTAFGFLRQRNNMATLCTLAWAALLSLSYHGKLRLQWAVLASAALMAALAATASRTGFLQLMVLTCLWLTPVFLRPRALIARTVLSHVALCLASLVSYAFAVWLLPQLIGSGETLVQRVLDTASASPGGVQLHDSRQQLWDNTWRVATQHPLWGVGWRELAYSLHMADFGVAERFGSQADNAHNLPLQWAAELGIPFALLWTGALVGYLFYRADKAWSARHQLLEGYSLLGWAVILVLAIHSLLEYPLWYAPFQIALGLALGLIHSPHSRSPHSMPQHKSLQCDTPSRLGGAALILFCTYAAFDYHRVSQLFLKAEDRSALYQSNTGLKADRSWLFANQVRFAKLLATPVTAQNAESMWVLGQQVIHFSPEPSVFKALIAAGTFLAPTDTHIAAQLVVLRRQLLLIER